VDVDGDDVDTNRAEPRMKLIPIAILQLVIGRDVSPRWEHQWASIIPIFCVSQPRVIYAAVRLHFLRQVPTTHCAMQYAPLAHDSSGSYTTSGTRSDEWAIA